MWFEEKTSIVLTLKVLNHSLRKQCMRKCTCNSEESRNLYDYLCPLEETRYISIPHIIIKDYQRAVSLAFLDLGHL